MESVTIASGGRFAGVAPCGTALTAAQVALLGQVSDLRAVGAVIAFDPDQAGRKAAVAAYHLLAPRTGALTTAGLARGCDPAQVLRDHGPAALARALAGGRPLADVVVDTAVGGWSRWLRYPEGQFNALHSAAPVIAAMPPSQVARQVTRLARRLGLDYATITSAVADAVADVVGCTAVPSRLGAVGRPPPRAHHGAGPARQRGAGGRGAGRDDGGAGGADRVAWAGVGMSWRATRSRTLRRSIPSLSSIARS